MAWTSIAFSPDGMMVGSDAVIGLPDDTSVLEYEMSGQVGIYVRVVVLEVHGMLCHGGLFRRTCSGLASALDPHVKSACTSCSKYVSCCCQKGRLDVQQQRDGLGAFRCPCTGVHRCVHVSCIIGAVSLSCPPFL